MNDPRRGVPISGTPNGQRVVRAAILLSDEQGNDTGQVTVRDIVGRTGLGAGFVKAVLDHVFGIQEDGSS
jgi:hypothetical protein